jgi:hypothetical protein
MAFPPVPVYPDAIDSDYTLYVVHNTTETKLRADSPSWSQEIEIVPVTSDKADIWADNGFANIEGELLYYDSVEKNANDKVIKLKGCSRQLGGNTQWNARGTWIRSFVVAEHHNQLMDAILKTQDFIGYNFDDRQKTLDWRIRNLEELQIVFDDFDCPDVVFTFNIEEDDPITGKLASYLLEISPPGSINNFRLDFGDGNFTTTEIEGTHRYAVNARVDPIVTVANDKCEILQTPIERINPVEPSPQIEAVFEIVIPEIPDIPDFTFVACEVPEPDINLPPLIVPCISLEGQVGPLPSVITGPDITLVSNVTIAGPDQPVQILHSTVTITGGVTIPPVILIDPPVPPTIIVDPPIPPTIIIVPPQSQITLELDATELPRLEVDWGAPPEMEVALTLAKNVKTPQRFAVDPDIVGEFGEEFADLFEASETMKVEYETVGIPEEIVIVPPNIPAIKVDTEGMPSKIKVDASEVKIPDIQIHGPKSPIPNSIRLDGSEVPEAVDLVYKGKAIPVEITGMPSVVEVKMEKPLPERILVETVEPIPATILVEHDLPEKLILEGPASIPLELPEDIVLPVKFPEVMPEVEMIYRGAPIEVKLTFDEILNKEADGRNCVMISPCPTQ